MAAFRCAAVTVLRPAKIPAMRMTFSTLRNPPGSFATAVSRSTSTRATRPSLAASAATSAVDTALITTGRRIRLCRCGNSIMIEGKVRSPQSARSNPPRSDAATSQPKEDPLVPDSLCR